MKRCRPGTRRVGAVCRRKSTGTLGGAGLNEGSTSIGTILVGVAVLGAGATLAASMLAAAAARKAKHQFDVTTQADAARMRAQAEAVPQV